jgi:ABC-type transport system involved in cytochrome bd biosynthesis fused ATPase/permease subunit
VLVFIAYNFFGHHLGGVLQHGEIKERGSHRELLAQQGLYQKLYQLQLRGQEQRKIA